MNELGITLREIKETQEAIKWLTKGAEAGNLSSMNELGITLREVKQTEEAIKWLTKGAVAGNSFCITELGITLRGINKIGEAIQWFNKGAKLNNSHCVFQLAIIYKAMGEYKLAISFLEKSITLWNSIRPNIELYGCYMQTKEYHKAVGLVEKMMDNNLPDIKLYIDAIKLCIYKEYNVNQFATARTILSALEKIKDVHIEKIEQLRNKINTFEQGYK